VGRRLAVTEEIASSIIPYSTWRNKKGGSLYTVLGLSMCSTNGEREGEQDVVYISHSYQRLRHREVYEFLKKFEREPAQV
jgi:hypothetical protein